MAVRRPRKHKRFAVLAKTSTLASSHTSNFGYRHARCLGGAAKGGEVSRRDRQRDLIIVTTGQNRFHQFGLGGERCARSFGERHLRRVNVNRHF